jgi:hypothetical protein
MRLFTFTSSSSFPLSAQINQPVNAHPPSAKNRTTGHAGASSGEFGKQQSRGTVFDSIAPQAPHSLLSSCCDFVSGQLYLWILVLTMHTFFLSVGTAASFEYCGCLLKSSSWHQIRTLFIVFLASSPGGAAGYAAQQQSAHHQAGAEPAMAPRRVDPQSWAELTSATESSGTVHLSPHFKMGEYTKEINFNGKALVIWGNNAILDAAWKGRFFGAEHNTRNNQQLSSGINSSSLELHNITLRRGKPHFCSNICPGGAIVIFSGSLLLFDTKFQENIARPADGQATLFGGGAVGGLGLGELQLKIWSSEFESNAATGGGAIYFSELGATFLGSLEIHGSTFKNNHADGAGGAIHVEFGAQRFGGSVLIHACTFTSNTASGTGGAVNVFGFSQHNVGVIFSACTFVYNKAGISGGAISAGSAVPNGFTTVLNSSPLPPSNLAMFAVLGDEDAALCVPNFTFCFGVSCFPYNVDDDDDGGNELVGRCVDPGHNVLPDAACTRKWMYGSEIIVESCTMRDNSAGSPNSTQAFGGALHVVNMNATIVDTVIQNNMVIGAVGSAGGAISLGPGKARLTLKGSTSLKNNSAAKGAGQSAVHSASDAEIAMHGPVQIEIEQNGEALRLQGSSDLVLSEEGQLTCAAGAEMEYDIIYTAQQFDSWTIDCSQVRLASNGSGIPVAYSNPTCNQLKWLLPNKEWPTCGGNSGGNYTSTNEVLAPYMRLVTGTISCTFCVPGLYSLEQSSKKGNQPPNSITCLPCPYGADCNQGGARLRAKSNFWGFVDVDNRRVKFLQCPRDYCCRADGPCDWRKKTGNGSACQGHRDPQIPLCGGCLQDYSETIDTNTCVRNSECGIHKKALLYLLLKVIYWMCLVLYFLYNAQFKPVQKLMDRLGANCNRCALWVGRSFGCLSRTRKITTSCIDEDDGGGSRGPGCCSGAESVVIYFYQLAMLVVPEGCSVLAAIANDYLTRVGNAASGVLPHGGGSAGVCIYVGMNGVQKMLLGLATPVMIGMLLVFVRWVFLQTDRGREGIRERDPLHESLLSHSSVNDSQLSSAERLEPTTTKHEERHRNSRQEDHGGMRTSSRNECTEAGVLTDAMVFLGLFMYSSFAALSFKLVNCVQVIEPTQIQPTHRHHQLVLRYAGAQKCNLAAWQAPIVLLVALLTALPLFPITIWVLSLKWASVPARVTQWACSSSLRLEHARGLEDPSILETTSRFAARPFLPHYWHWAFMLLLQRLLTVMCSALATTGVETSVGVALISFAFLLMQMLARPYRLSWVNTLQTCSHICLVTLAILNSTSGAFLSTGFDLHTSGDTTLLHFQTVLEVLMLLVLFPPPLIYLWYVLAPKMRCCGFCARRRQRVPDSQGSIIDSLDVSEGDSDEEQQRAGPSEIERLQRLLAESETEREVEKDRLLAEKEEETERLQRLLAETSEAERERETEKERLLAEKEEEKERLLAEKGQWMQEKQQLQREKAQLKEQLSAETPGARG